VDGEGYLLDNLADEAEHRFAALAALFDPVTDRHLDVLGVGPGWRCWEVGAGGPSVPDALAARVRPGGRVVATDLETHWLAGATAPGVEVLTHDVVRDEPPGDDFDLVHARLVLVHVPERELAVRRMAAALRPGGWLLLEDFDVALQPLVCPDETTAEQRLANDVKDGFRRLLLARGADLQLGRRLPRVLRENGLEHVAADAWFPLADPAVAALERANVLQVREALTTSAGVPAADVDRYLELVGSEGFDLTTAPLVSAWGRRPEPARG
jgi:SAM-dependent methyltransferase